jgi:hypothetical protein
MALGPSAAEANAFLDSHVDSRWVQLHTADPGTGGTAVANGGERQQITGAPSASGGIKVTGADLDWLDVATTEEYTHYSLWTASTSGTFIGSGSVTGGSVTAGNNFQIPAGDFSVSIPVAS